MDLYDAWTPANIPGGATSRMLYLDGGGAASPADIAQAQAAGALIMNTVLADRRAVVFDYEPGNAPMDSVATACALRLDDGLWSTVYCDGADIGAVVSGLRAKSLSLVPASSWPAPGVYLHAADPTGTPHLDVAWAPVQPVAVQDRWLPLYDVSSTYGTYPLPPAPTPPPTPPGDADMATWQFARVNETGQILLCYGYLWYRPIDSMQHYTDLSNWMAAKGVDVTLFGVNEADVAGLLGVNITAGS